MTRALRLAPWRDLPLARTSPLFAKVVDRQRQALRAEPTGSALFQSTPAGAAIAVDGLELGTAPLRVRGLPVGEHLWRAQLVSGEALGGLLDVTSGREATVTAATLPNSDAGSIDNCQLSIVNCQSSASGEAPGAEQRPSRHTVQAGETASEIAKRYSANLADLLAVNNIANADAIFVGQVLAIPDLATATPSTRDEETTVEATSAIATEPLLGSTPEPTPNPAPAPPYERFTAFNSF